jgi:hypothetical protein
MDRTRGLFTPGNKEANRMGWLLCKVNLGGLGRNRTTDTRIFNLLLLGSGDHEKGRISDLHGRAGIKQWMREIVDETLSLVLPVRTAIAQGQAAAQ